MVGSDTLGLYYGIGKLLHSAKWSESEFSPCSTNGVVSPACVCRTVSYAIHFYNWYQMAPDDEQESYLEDLLLWGYNTFHCALPIVNATTFEDDMFVKAVKNVRRLFKMAKKFGMKLSLSVCKNQGMRSSPKEYAADMSTMNLKLRGNLGRNLCPSNPEALEHLRWIWRSVMENFRDIGLDQACCWPYDEGGCGCEKCRPWGAVGYGNMIKAFKEELVKIFPNAKINASTWAFDAPDDEGEYAGFYERLKGDLSDVVDSILVDAHGDFPRYPLEHEPIKPIVNFPEISMWGLAPWGGFGANPLPERFQRIWDSSKHIISGGIPYTEGLYEDISKVQWIGYYWHPEKHYSEILAEYVSYEYGEEFVEDAIELMRLIEINHTHIGNREYSEAAVAEKALEIAEYINERLSERAKYSWRWRILYIRARLDQKRYAALLADKSDDPKKIKRFTFYSGDLLLEDAEAQEMFLELQGYYHCIPHNGENHHTLPPYGGTKLDVVI
ncbi:MAG: hypothetical protein IJY97_03985 [Clostridia bacterium]|nr:hypothetical protein [Clostridia bacterium]